jgi:hypothetical protein
MRHRHQLSCQGEEEQRQSGATSPAVVEAVAAVAIVEVVGKTPMRKQMMMR